MVRNISLFLFLIFIGCEINSKQIIRPEKFKFDIIKFNTVSKILENKFEANSPDHEIMSEIIQYWFDNRVKTDGFEGNLSVNFKQIQFDREKKQDYYKFSVSLSIEFIEQKNPQQTLDHIILTQKSMVK